MGTGIEIFAPGAAGSGTNLGIVLSGDENIGFGGSTDHDVFTYNAEINAGQSMTFSGNFGAHATSADNQPYVVTGAPTFGTFNFNTADGTFTYTLTRAELDANGGDQTISFQVQGLGSESGGNPATLDTDTVQFVITCFTTGTQITTPKGETAVEMLQIGDLLRTADGRDVPVKWIGKQTVSTLFHPAERLMPVRFAAGSLGDGLPREELTVTADHAMLVDGVLCQAGALVNGDTITRVPLGQMGTSYDIYHVETEDHEIILANGAATETFIDSVSRRVFANFDEYLSLYGDESQMQELPLPRAMTPRQVPWNALPKAQQRARA